MTASRPAAEPLFNAPAPVLVVVASILGAYLLQSRAPDPDAVVRVLGLVPRQVAQGRLWPLLTVVLVHGGWVHAGLNALGALAFGTPVARALGRGGAGAAGAGRAGAGPSGLLRFLAFYLTCGLASSIGYVLLHWGEAIVLVGASGAISGLMGATSRLIDRRGALGPFRSRTVIGMAGAWLLINLLMAVRWIDVGAGGAPIAWEAHLFGYAAGLLLIGPFVRAGEPRSGGTTSNV